jgi:hypothetical protein
MRSKRKVYRVDVFCGDSEFTSEVLRRIQGRFPDAVFVSWNLGENGVTLSCNSSDEIKTFIDYAETAELNNKAMNDLAMRNR